jgi:hypothetical protein
MKILHGKFGIESPISNRNFPVVSVPTVPKALRNESIPGKYRSVLDKKSIFASNFHFLLNKYSIYDQFLSIFFIFY